MNLTGKLIKKNQVQTGVNEKNNTEWKNQTLLFEHVGNSFLNEWNNKFAVKVIEKNLDKVEKLEAGNIYDVKVNVSSREFNGKYYTTLTAWSFVNKDLMDVNNNTQADNNDDLPF